MIKDAEQFKQADKDFSARHEAKSDLEAYIHQVEGTITSPEIGMKLKRGAKGQVEAELARALEKLEIEESTSDELRKAQLGIKRALQKSDCRHSLGYFEYRGGFLSPCRLYPLSTVAVYTELKKRRFLCTHLHLYMCE